MIASLMGDVKTVKMLITEAKKRLKPEHFDLFVNIKVIRSMGGNSALLYACSSNQSKTDLVDYLI